MPPVKIAKISRHDLVTGRTVSPAPNSYVDTLNIQDPTLNIQDPQNVAVFGGKVFKNVTKVK